MSTTGGRVKDQVRGAEQALRGRITALEASLGLAQAENEQLWALAEMGARARLALEGVLLDRDLLAERCRKLEAENTALARDNARLGAENTRLAADNSRLAELVERLDRAGHRQSAPFSKNNPKACPRRPGRRAGLAYGRRGHRSVPSHIDDDIVVPRPRFCPDCGEELIDDGEDIVYEQELPEAPVRTTRYRMCRGRCPRCRNVVRARHPNQSSVALGAAACHLGPRAVGFITELNKGCGVSAAKIARLLALFGLAITAGGVVAVLKRAARAAEPTYRALIEGVRNSGVVSPDETGWRVGGRSAWLWAFVGEGVCVHRIASGRGFAQAVVILGADFDGVLVRDGWVSYTKFALAHAQTCLAHLLRRAHLMIEAGADHPAGLACRVRGLLKDALALRDAQHADELTADDYVAGIEALALHRDELLSMEPADAAEARFLRHLSREAEVMFTFLSVPGVAATNCAAEQAIRPAVVNRKSWGGNVTWDGAHVCEVLTSVIATARMQHRDPVGIVASLLMSPKPIVADLAIPPPKPRRLALPAARSP